MKIIVSENQFGKIMRSEGKPSDVLIEQVVAANPGNQLTILQQKINAIINDPKKEKAILDNINIKLNLTKENAFVLQIGQKKFPMKQTSQGVYGIVLPPGQSITTSEIPISSFMGEIEKLPEYKALIETNPKIQAQLQGMKIYNQLYSDRMGQGYFELRLHSELKDRKEERLAVDVRRPYPLGEFFEQNKVVYKFPPELKGIYGVLSMNMVVADLSSINLTPAAPKVQQQTYSAPVNFDFPGLGDVFNFGDVTFKDEDSVNRAIQGFVQKMKQYAAEYGQPFIEHVKKQNPIVKGYASVDGDPNQQIKGEYQPCSGSNTRAEYDMCLSHERAKLIANILNKGLPEFGGVFQFQGMGETTEFSNGVGWTPENPTSPSETAANRRYVLDRMKPFQPRTQ